MKLFYKTIFLLFIFFLISCKKDKKDTQPPVISFNTPTSGQAYSFLLDTASKTYYIPISVNAHVSDNEHLSSITISLTDANYVAQQPGISVSISSNNFIANATYKVTQFHLQTGTYYIQITADDGYNTTTSYQAIYITESPTQLWGYCMVLKSNNKLISYYDTTATNLISSITLNQTYTGMKYGGYYNQLYINGNGTQTFQSFNIQQQSSFLNYTESDNTYNYTCLYTDGNKPYVGYYNGDIRSYQNTGSQSTSFRYTPSPSAYAYYFTTTSLYGVAAFRNTFGTPNDQLVTFTIASGSTFQSLPLANGSSLNSIVSVFEKSPDSLYVLGNDAGNNAVVYIYEALSNNFSASSLLAIGAGKMLSAAMVNNEYIIFSTTTGSYSCKGLSVNTISGIGSAQKLFYQPKLNRLMAASNTNLSSYYVSPASLTPISTKVLTDSIIDFEVITNK